MNGGGVAEDEWEQRFGAGGHRLDGIEAAPVTDDLGEDFFACVIVSRPVFGDGLPEDFAGFVILAAV